jgi:hypothetical protein
MSTELELPGVSGPVVDRPLTTEELGEAVRSALARSVEGVLDAGRHLIRAKGQVDHGEWESWCRESAGVSPQTALKLIKVAGHPVLSNPAHVRYLPQSWGTLAVLAQARAETVEAAIKLGDITPDMTREQAAAKIREWDPELARPKAAPALDQGPSQDEHKDQAAGPVAETMTAATLIAPQAPAPATPPN